MATVNRFDIWVAELPVEELGQRFGKRPILVVSDQIWNIDTVFAIPLKTLKHGEKGPIVHREQFVLEMDGLKYPSVVGFTTVLTVPLDKLKNKVGVLPEEHQERVNDGLKKVFGLASVTVDEMVAILKQRQEAKR